MKRVCIAVLSMLAAGTALTPGQAQIAGQAAAGPPLPAPALQVYSNAELHLTFSYPAGLTPRDGAFAAAAARRMLYGEDAESERSQADACTTVLLSVGTGTEGRGAWGRLGLLEIHGQCFPAKTLQNKKASQLLLRNLVKQGTTTMGMMPLDQPAVYLIQGRWASFCAAQGQPVSGGDLQSADQQLVSVVAVLVQSEVLGWVVETNDGAMLNRVLGSGVDFGTGKPERLFPGLAK